MRGFFRICLLPAVTELFRSLGGRGSGLVLVPSGIESLSILCGIESLLKEKILDEGGRDSLLCEEELIVELLLDGLESVFS